MPFPPDPAKSHFKRNRCSQHIDSPATTHYIWFQIRRGSSGAEQRTHKPLVGSSNLPPATIESLVLRGFLSCRGFLSPKCWERKGVAWRLGTGTKTGTCPSGSQAKAPLPVLEHQERGRRVRNYFHLSKSDLSAGFPPSNVPGASLFLGKRFAALF